jgi:hypothetical protein
MQMILVFIVDNTKMRACITMGNSSIYFVDSRSRREEFAQAAVERLLSQIFVMNLSHLQRRPNHFQSNQFVSTLLKPGNDITDESSLNSIGLHGQEGTLLVGSGNSMNWKGITGYNLVVLELSGGDEGRGCSDECQTRKFGSGCCGGTYSSGLLAQPSRKNGKDALETAHGKRVSRCV